jgi:broad specificity phosphatase PhoE
MGLKKEDIIYNSNLVERDTGLLTGAQQKDDPMLKRAEEIQENYTGRDPIEYEDKYFGEFAADMKKEFNVESNSEMNKRIDDFVKTLPKSGSVLILTHNGYIRRALSHLLNLNQELIEPHFKYGKNCHITLLRKKGSTWYLRAGPTTDYLKYFPIKKN